MTWDEGWVGPYGPSPGDVLRQYLLEQIMVDAPGGCRGGSLGAAAGECEWEWDREREGEDKGEWACEWCACACAWECCLGSGLCSGLCSLLLLPPRRSDEMARRKASLVPPRAPLKAVAAAQPPTAVAPRMTPLDSPSTDRNTHNEPRESRLAGAEWQGAKCGPACVQNTIHCAPTASWRQCCLCLNPKVALGR